jgi:formamidopyrimidine-DNA glycosylase
LAELPELLHLVAALSDRLVGRRVRSDRVPRPGALHVAVQGNLSLLQGRRLEKALRQAHLVVLRFGGLDLAVEPAPDGRLRFAVPDEPDEGNLVLALGFDDGDPLELRYLDPARLASAWLITSEDWGSIPGLQHGGVDVLSRAFTPERLASLLRRGSGPVRDVLMNRRAIDSLGPAWADAVLLEARLHPRTPARAVPHESAVALHGAIQRLLGQAVEASRRLDPGLEAAARGLRPLDGQGCPRCGKTLVQSRLKSGTARLCPACQPPPASGRAPGRVR